MAATTTTTVAEEIVPPLVDDDDMGSSMGNNDPDHDPYAYSEDNDDMILRGKRLQGVCPTTNAPNFHTIYRKKNVSPGNDRKYPVRFFTTRYTPGSRIRNAITGEMEPVRVGTIDERRYFKVGLSTGELGNDAQSRHLYYDSPDQYERHFGIRLSPEIVTNWYATQTW
jgi:hypothetical protein